LSTKFGQTCGGLDGLLIANCHPLPLATIPFCHPAAWIVAKSWNYTKVSAGFGRE
jgi:hypothetical protein